MSRVKISPTNIGNRLKMSEAGFERWRPHTFFEGYNKDGSTRVREGFKNTLTDQEVTPPEGWNADLSHLDHGDLARVSHSGNAYRDGWERIWGSVNQPRELMCLWRTKLWEGLIPFASELEEPDDDRSNDNQQGPVAQMVEQESCKLQVAGSIPGQDLHKKKTKSEYDWRIVVTNSKG